MFTDLTRIPDISSRRSENICTRRFSFYLTPLLSIPAARPAKCIGVESNFATLQLGQVDARKMGWRRSQAGVLSTVPEGTDNSRSGR